MSEIEIHKSVHKSDNLYLKHAYETAKKSDMEHKHGCIIVDNKGNIISSGYNKFLNVPKDKLQKFNKNTNIKISKHAEEMALKNADPKKLFGAKLYIVRINLQHFNNNPFMCSKPCKRCTAIIESCMKKCGLKIVYYT
jgi:tRNA(Arg) A34 adenosine deaminase TadA